MNGILVDSCVLLDLFRNVLSGLQRNQGTKHSTLPDFFIGAHASVSSFDLMTRDVSRYRSYFPKLNLIIPDDT